MDQDSLEAASICDPFKEALAFIDRVVSVPVCACTIFCHSCSWKCRTSARNRFCLLRVKGSGATKKKPTEPSIFCPGRYFYLQNSRHRRKKHKKTFHGKCFPPLWCKRKHRKRRQKRKKKTMKPKKIACWEEAPSQSIKSCFALVQRHQLMSNKKRREAGEHSLICVKFVVKVYHLPSCLDANLSSITIADSNEEKFRRINAR